MCHKGGTIGKRDELYENARMKFIALYVNLTSIKKRRKSKPYTETLSTYIQKSNKNTKL